MAGAEALGRSGLSGFGRSVGRRRSRSSGLKTSASVRWQSDAGRGVVAGPGDEPGREPLAAPTVQLADEGSTDLFTYLLTSRIVYVHKPIDEGVANSTLASLMAMELQDPSQDIKLYLNSSGAVNHCVMGLVDVVQSLQCDVQTFALGSTGGNVTLLLAAGTRGKRYAMPSTRIALGQPRAGAAGSSYDVNIQVKEQNRNLKSIVELYQRFTGLDRGTVEQELDREHAVSPQEAQHFGLIDEVISVPAHA